jgi:hypothetical protein
VAIGANLFNARNHAESATIQTSPLGEATATNARSVQLSARFTFSRSIVRK